MVHWGGKICGIEISAGFSISSDYTMEKVHMIHSYGVHFIEIEYKIQGTIIKNTFLLIRFWCIDLTRVIKYIFLYIQAQLVTIIKEKKHGFRQLTIK